MKNPYSHLIFTIIFTTSSLIATQPEDTNKNIAKTKKTLFHSLSWSFVSGVVTPLPPTLKNITRSNAAYSLGMHFFGLLTSVKQTEQELPNFGQTKRFIAKGLMYYIGQTAQFGLWKLIQSYAPKNDILLMSTYVNLAHTAHLLFKWGVPLAAHFYIWRKSY